MGYIILLLSPISYVMFSFEKRNPPPPLAPLPRQNKKNIIIESDCSKISFLSFNVVFQIHTELLPHVQLLLLRDILFCVTKFKEMYSYLKYSSIYKYREDWK